MTGGKSGGKASGAQNHRSIVSQTLIRSCLWLPLANLVQSFVQGWSDASFTVGATCSPTSSESRNYAQRWSVAFPVELCPKISCISQGQLRSNIVVAQALPSTWPPFSNTSPLKSSSWLAMPPVTTRRRVSSPVILQLAIRNDEELNKLLGHVTIAQGGVLPNIHQSKFGLHSTRAQSILTILQTFSPRRPPRVKPAKNCKCLLSFLVWVFKEFHDTCDHIGVWGWVKAAERDFQNCFLGLYIKSMHAILTSSRMAWIGMGQ